MAKNWAVSHIITGCPPHKTVWFLTKEEANGYLEEQGIEFLSFWKENNYEYMSFAPISDGLAMIGKDGTPEGRMVIVNTNTDDKSLFCKGLGGVQTMTAGTSIERAPQ